MCLMVMNECTRVQPMLHNDKVFLGQVNQHTATPDGSWKIVQCHHRSIVTHLKSYIIKRAFCLSQVKLAKS